MHYKTSASPGLQPVLHKKESHPSSTETSMSGGHASFAAALRKLAKQAKPVLPSTSSPPPAENRSKSASPVVSAVNSGMSPSQTASPLAGLSDHEGNTKEQRGDHSSPGIVGIRTPPVPNIAPLDPDHRSPRPGSEQKHDASRGPQRTQVNHPLIGHEVIPGVFSSVPREVPMLSEHFPSEPSHAPVAFYPAYGPKPDLPLYLPRAAHPSGPPPLLASKRDGPEAHMLPFYPTPYPPPVMEHPDLRFSTWRQQRAAEHLRQQHERHSILPDGTIVVEPFEFPLGHVSDTARHMPPGGVEPFFRKNSPHLRNADNSDSRETRKQESRDSAKKDKEMDLIPGEHKQSSSEGPPHRSTNQEHKQGSSCPVHGHGTSTGPSPPSSASEPVRSHSSHARADPALMANIPRPGEYKRMFLQPHEVPMIHPYLVHPPRDAPYPIHPLDERHAEFMRERERQDFLLQERLMLEQKGLCTAEEWQRHHLQKDKPAGLGVVHYPQPIHQQGPLETSKSPHPIEHHKGDSSVGRLVPGREAGHLYRGFPYHSFHRPPPEGKGFSDHFGNEADLRHPHNDIMRRSVGPPEQLVVPYLDSNAFGHKSFHSSPARVDSGKDEGERRWQQGDRRALVNGEYHHDEPRTASSERSSPGLAKRIKVERSSEEAPEKPVNKIRHDPSKLTFLEGLGLVTVHRKKEIREREPTLKRKFSDVQGNENGVESSNKMVTNENLNGDHKTNDNNSTVEPLLSGPEKLDFMAKLGLLPPSKRQELEQSFEIKRNERKNRKSRGRPPKRARRDKENDRDSDNSQGSLEREVITGPITRQKQQLLQEQEKKENRSKDVEKTHSVSIKTEEGEKRTTSFRFDNGIFRRNSNDRYQPNPETSSGSNHIPPRLTLQSLTNMEDPFSNISASEFRPPYLRHTGLLSISHEHGAIAPHARQEHRTQPIRPEPLRSAGMSFSEKETRDYLSQCSSSIPGHPFGSLPLAEQGGHRNRLETPTAKDEKSKSSQDGDTYKWAGIEAVMQSYLMHAAERGMEIGVLQDNAELLKSHNVSLHEEAQTLSLQITNLVQAKRDLVEERNTLRQGLDKLHFFIESLKR